VVKEKQIPFLEFNDLKIQRLQHSTESTASALVLNNLDKRNSKEQSLITSTSRSEYGSISQVWACHSGERISIKSQHQHIAQWTWKEDVFLYQLDVW